MRCHLWHRNCNFDCRTRHLRSCAISDLIQSFPPDVASFAGGSVARLKDPSCQRSCAESPASATFEPTDGTDGFLLVSALCSEFEGLKLASLCRLRLGHLCTSTTLQHDWVCGLREVRGNGVQLLLRLASSPSRASGSRPRAHHSIETKIHYMQNARTSRLLQSRASAWCLWLAAADNQNQAMAQALVLPVALDRGLMRRSYLKVSSKLVEDGLIQLASVVYVSAKSLRPFPRRGHLSANTAGPGPKRTGSGL